jgi:hypothetical protein
VRRISMLTPRTRRTPATTNDDAAAQRPQEPPYRPAREAALSAPPQAPEELLTLSGSPPETGAIRSHACPRASPSHHRVPSSTKTFQADSL